MADHGDHEGGDWMGKALTWIGIATVVFFALRGLGVNLHAGSNNVGVTWTPPGSGYCCSRDSISPADYDELRRAYRY